MNKVILIGNLTKDVDLSVTQSGLSVAKFTLAVQRKFKNASGDQETDFLNIIAWRQLGEVCQKYLKKGSKACVTGSIQIRSYEQEGVRKYATDIIAEDVEFLTQKSENAEQAPKREKAKRDDLVPFEDDLPF